MQHAKFSPVLPACMMFITGLRCRHDARPVLRVQGEAGQTLGRAFLASVGYDNAARWRGLSVPILFAFMIAVNVATVLCFRFLDGASIRGTRYSNLIPGWLFRSRPTASAIDCAYPALVLRLYRYRTLLAGGFGPVVVYLRSSRMEFETPVQSMSVADRRHQGGFLPPVHVT